MTAPEFKEGQRLELTTHRRQIARLRRWLVLVSVLATLAAIAGGVGFFSARAAIGRTNGERARNSERNCLDVNVRHDRTIAALDSILAERLRTASPVERARLLTSRQTTVLLIESLTPKRDCGAYARQQVSNP